MVSDQEPRFNMTGFPIVTPNRCTEDGCVGRLWIYYSDALRIYRWGTIRDATQISSYARNVICRQLGYKSSDTSNPPTQPELENPDLIPVWLKDINCPDDGSYPFSGMYANNILQCDPSVCEGCMDHNADLIISCGKQKIISECALSLCDYRVDTVKLE